MTTRRSLTCRIPLSPRWFIVLLLPLILLPGCCAGPAWADPFGGRSLNDRPAATAPQDDTTIAAAGAKTGLLGEISRWQMVLRQKIASAVRDYTHDGHILPLLPLFGLVLLYGALHAAGPGHGKAVAMGYALARGRGYGSGLVLGTLISLVHTAAAVLLVLVLRLILRQSVSGGLERVSRITQLVSAGLIVLIGGIILTTALAAWKTPRATTENDEPARRGRLVHHPLVAALIIGMVPCPGVIVILLFCLSLDQLPLGLLLAATVSIGMAVTITLAVWLSLAGKHLTLRLSARDAARLGLAERALRVLAGLALVVLGTLSFASLL